MNLTSAIFGAIKAKSQGIEYSTSDIFLEEEIEFIEDLCIQFENLENSKTIQTKDLITALKSLNINSIEIKNLISLLVVSQYLNAATYGNQRAPSQLDQEILKIWGTENEDMATLVEEAKSTIRLICSKMANEALDDSDEEIETIVYPSLS